MLRASIDIGSNSVLLLIASVEDGRISEVENLAYVTSLGKDLDKNQTFLDSSMEDTFNALKHYKSVAEKHGLKVSDVLVTATEASRVAKNAPTFFNKIKNELGFQIDIISSDAEAYFAARGVSLDAHSQDAVILDIGGASSELIKIKSSPFEVCSSISLPIGSVRALDLMEQNKLGSRLSELLDEKLSIYKTDQLICIAGTMTSLANMFQGESEYTDEKVRNLEIGVDKFSEFVVKLENKTGAELNEEFPFLGKRANFIYSGALVALKIAKAVEAKTLKISTYGLRYGVILQGSTKYGN